MLEAEDGFLKTRIKELPSDKPLQNNHQDKELDRRFKIYRECTAGDLNLRDFFSGVIGAENCAVLEGPENMEDEKKALSVMTNLAERNGKPCCINLITEADNKFLKKLETDGD